MPITPQEATMYLAQNGTSLSHLIPAFPGRTMKKEEAEELVELREHVVSCFFITPGHTPIIPDDGSDLRKDADTQARVVMSSSSHLRERLKGRKPYQPTVLGDKELDALLSSYSGALDGRRRRLVWLLSDPAVSQYAEAYVKSVAGRMLRASAIMQSVDQALFLVARDWRTSTVYERARGLDAARRYAEWIRTAAQLAVVGHSLSHSAPLAAFVARARRAGSRAAVWAAKA